MKSLTNLRKGLALVLCAAMLMGDTTMLQAAQVESTTVGAIVSESKAETEVAEDVPTEEVEQEQEEAEVVEPQAEATEVSEAEEKSEESEETQVEAPDVETALENKALEATYTATVGETTVTVVAPEGAFTEEVTLQVTEVEITDEMQAQLDEQAIAEQKAINSASAYDISFVNAEGKEVEPAKEVQVSIATAEVNSGDDASVYHFDEEKAAVADMDATVVESGDVAFGTDHFSTYVIVNKGENTVTVKIHHVERLANNDTRVVYYEENKLPVGAKLSNYAKLDNWKVYGMYAGEVGDEDHWYWENEIDTVPVVRDAEVWLYYDAKNQDVDGQVTLWDYDVKPIYYSSYRYNYSVGLFSTHHYYTNDGNLSGKNVSINNKSRKLSSRTKVSAYTPQLLRDIFDKDNTAHDVDWSNWYFVDEELGAQRSINYISNFENQQGYDRNRAYLTSGKTNDHNYDANKHDDTYEGVKINNYNGGNIAPKLVAGLNDDGTVRFNVNQPGLFSEVTTENDGKTVYNEDQFKLVFSKHGVTYNLSSVYDNENRTTVATAGKDFFPLNQRGDKSHDGANNQGNNDFFGMRYDVEFQIGDYVGPLTYSFTGDDDLWVVLDGKDVVIDIGGIHTAQSQTVDLWKYIDPNGTHSDLTKQPAYDKTKTHTLTVLYMERGATDSNCQMDFTIPYAEFRNYKIATADLEFTKVDEEDQTIGLANAKFELTREDMPNYKRSAVSDENGRVFFGDLIKGTYTLTETIQPEGYELPTASWIVKVTENEDKTVATATLYEADGESEVIDNLITNTKTEEPVIPTYNSSKTAKVTDYDKREYEITLTAKSTTQATSTTTSGGPVDVMLLLDQSGSMEDPVETNVKYTAGKTYGQLKKSWSTGSGMEWRHHYNNHLDDYSSYYVAYGDGYYQLHEDYNNELGVWKTTHNYSYYINLPGGNWVKIDDATVLYTKTATTSTRMEALKSSASQFLTSISEKSPKSKVGIVAFSSEGYGGANNLYSLQQIGKNPANAIKTLDGLKANGGTSPELAMQEARRQLANAKDGRKKVVILFTDGRPTGNSTDGTWKSQIPSENEATSLKNDGVIIYTIGLTLEEDAKEWLSNNIASSPAHALTADTADELTKIFESISQTITNNLDIENATITDVLDPRFELVETPEGATVSADGRTITWTGQTIPYKENWTRTIKIKAKPDFLGGNKIPTNIAPQSGITIGEGTTPVPFENQPTVNVKLLNLTGAADEETVFLGDSIDASDLDKTLAKAIKENGTVLLQNPTFNAQGQITVDYIYPGTTDKVGTITFTKKAEGEGAAFTKHDAEYIGSPAELYTVTAEYKPLAPSERPKDLTATAADGGAVVTTSATATATHKVNVVAGKLTINKTISNADYKAAFGDPVFTFKITNDKGKTYYRTLRFSEIKAPAEGENPTDVTLTATITNLPSGNYKVKEMPTLGFELKDLTATGTNAGEVEKNKSDKEATFSFAYVDKQTEYTATVNYTNVTKHSPRDTDTDVVKNHFHVENGTVTITPDKNVDNGTTTDTSGRNVTTNN
jgi:fibro-slime domain-containing protein